MSLSFAFFFTSRPGDTPAARYLTSWMDNECRIERLEHEASKCDDLINVLLMATHAADADLPRNEEEPSAQEIASSGDRSVGSG
ncbi:hypothetical protein E2562_025961 [Oryza meyeriana var. granulata]|uniref:Uncharacterized protein n=1 Tax=Oryza meyeriana var. granulata TaxID=110450 RepID=A0A6G1EYV4_9ORYZ|nr:hypothetical protein E2562_025961 [Oryza meyeriana var. granulata]